MLVRPQQCTELYAAVPLLSDDDYLLKTTIEPFAFNPNEYSAQEYNKHIQLAYEHARAYYAKNTRNLTLLQTKAKQKRYGWKKIVKQDVVALNKYVTVS